MNYSQLTLQQETNKSATIELIEALETIADSHIYQSSNKLREIAAEALENYWGNPENFA